MELVFRNFRKSDFDKVKALALEGWYFAYSHLPKKELSVLVEKYYSDSKLGQALANTSVQKSYFVVALENKEIIGFSHISFEGSVGELKSIYVKPSKIRKGIGGKLLLLCEDFLKSKNIEKYFTFANKHNKIGMNFYKKNNFKRKPAKDKDDEFEKNVLAYFEKKI